MLWVPTFNRMGNHRGSSAPGVSLNVSTLSITGHCSAAVSDSLDLVLKRIASLARDGSGSRDGRSFMLRSSMHFILLIYTKFVHLNFVTSGHNNRRLLWLEGYMIRTGTPLSTTSTSPAAACRIACLSGLIQCGRPRGYEVEVGTCLQRNCGEGGREVKNVNRDT